MLECRYCPKGFVESMEGLITKTFHELLHEPETINTSLSKKRKILSDE